MASREPPFLEITYNPTTGIKTAEMQNPIAAKDHWLPDKNPNSGGNIRFPAPK